MGNAILKSLLLPVLLVQAGLLGAAEYRVCFRNNGPKATDPSFRLVSINEASYPLQ